MADAFGTLMQVVEVVNKVIEIYKKIEDAPQQIHRIGERMETLNTTLHSLESLLRTDDKNPLARLGPGLTDGLLRVIKNIRQESEEVQALFVKWEKDIGPWGLQFRFKFAAQAYFALGSSSDRLEALDNSIEKHRLELRELLTVMIGSGLNQLLVAGQGPGALKHRSPSPSPGPPRADFRIIFVDPYGTARSIVAEAYTSLLREWTIRTGGFWGVMMFHSAGYFVKSRSEVLDTIKEMQILFPSFNKGIKDGNSSPQPTAVAALFDNLPFNYAYKHDIRKAIQTRRSRGITKTIFKTYDYILVFTDREEHNLIQLRKLLIDKNGSEATTAMRKGKVVHLGSYLTPDATRTEIVAPKNDNDRGEWKAKVDQINLAIKGFLKRELDWKQPPQGAKQS